MSVYVLTLCGHCGDNSQYISRAPERDINCSECNNLMREGSYEIKRYIDEEHLTRKYEHAGHTLH